jgi:hypothetical protein
MPYRRMISAVLVSVMMLQIAGCSKTVWVGPRELQPEQRITSVVTDDGRVYELDPWVASLRGDTIYADSGDDALRFGVDEVRGVGVQRTDWPKTMLIPAGIVGVLAVITYAYATAP